MPWLERLLGRGPNPPLPTISADATGFTLTVRNRTRAVAWVVVSKVAAYKLDLGTRTQVVLLVELLNLKYGVIAIPEDSPGFAKLFGPMEQELGINPQAYLEIMSPTVKPRPTVLYVRGQDPDGLDAEA